MLVKTEKVSKTGKDIYLNKLTGKEGVLSSHEIDASSRRERRFGKIPINRHISDNRSGRVNVVKSNSKTTKGRVLQVIDTKVIKTKKISVPRTNRKGETRYKTIVIKTIEKINPIKVLHETHDSIRRKTNLLNFLERVQANKVKNDKSKKKEE